MNFQALEVALELVKALVPLIAKVARHSKTEAAQLDDAGNSIVRNLAEGRRRLGKDRTFHYSVAAGSADEVYGSLRLSIAKGWLEVDESATAIELDDRILAMTWRLTH